MKKPIKKDNPVSRIFRGFAVFTVLLITGGFVSGFAAPSGSETPWKPGIVPDAEKMGPSRSGTLKLWVYFKDRVVDDEAGETESRNTGAGGAPGLSAFQADRKISVNEQEKTAIRARRRRIDSAGAAGAARLLGRAIGVERLKSVGAFALRIRTVNRWLNAVSVEAGPDAAGKIRELPFVDSVVPVRCWAATPPPDADDADVRFSSGSEEFGCTDTQLGAVGARRLHDAGVKGAGVRIAVFDAGFWTEHRALEKMTIVGKHDFVEGDDDPMIDGPYASHGTAVLSIIGGSEPGVFTGVAPEADFLVARTEDLSSETPIEEDYWAAAVLWADSLGADIISSSLGYRWFDDPGDDHGYEELDGGTTVISQAARTAARLGILVCNSMGNNGHSIAGLLSAPADADSILAVGAADSTGEILNFSSGGPTSDGRIKPDILSMGSMIWAAKYCSDSDTCAYQGGFSGTSASTPLVAGAAALVKQHLGCGSLEAREHLLETASRAGFPDNIYGRGMAVAWRAAGFDPPEDPENDARIERAFPNPSESGRFTVEFTSGGEQAVELSICDASGRTFRFETVGSCDRWGVNRWDWDGRDIGGRNCPSGVYLVVLRAGSTNDIFKVAITR